MESKEISDKCNTELAGAVGYVNFWEKEKNNDYWSGSIVNLEWSELWPEAKQAIMSIYNSAVNSST